MALIRSLFWLALFLVSTFAFTVLFEYGWQDFGTNAQKEMEVLQKYMGGIQRPKDTSDKIAQ